MFSPFSSFAEKVKSFVAEASDVQIVIFTLEPEDEPHFAFTVM